MQKQVIITEEQLLKFTQIAGNIYKLTDGKLNNPLMQEINIQARQIQLDVYDILNPEQ